MTTQRDYRAGAEELFHLISLYGGKDIGSYKGISPNSSTDDPWVLVDTNEGGQIRIPRGGIEELQFIKDNVNSSNEMMRLETRKRLEGYTKNYTGPESDPE